MDAVALTLRLVLALGGVYLALCAALWAMQDNLIFHPQRLGPPPANPAANAVSLRQGEFLFHPPVWAVIDEFLGGVGAVA